MLKFNGTGSRIKDQLSACQQQQQKQQQEIVIKINNIKIFDQVAATAVTNSF